MPRFWPILVPLYRAGIGSGNMISLAAIMAQTEGPVNSQILVRDLRTIVGKSRQIRHHSGRPSFWTLIAAKDAAILAHFRRPYIGLEMGPEIGYSRP